MTKPTGPIDAQWYLENRTGKHNKFYEVTISGKSDVYSITTRHGKISHGGRITLVTANIDKASALAQGESIVEGKVAKGYKLIKKQQGTAETKQVINIDSRFAKLELE